MYEGAVMLVKKYNRLLLIFGSLILIILIGKLYVATWNAGVANQPSISLTNFKDIHFEKYSFIKWPKFRTLTKHDSEWYRKYCWLKPKFSIENLTVIISNLSGLNHPDCTELQRVFKSIYTVTKKPALSNYPQSFEAKIRKWLGQSPQLVYEAHHQTIVTVYNEYTDDNNNYNAIRDKRPMTRSGADEMKYLEKMVKATKATCDFCNYEFSTAKDVFGRIKGKTTVTAANAFRWDRWHSLVIPNNHHPIDWTWDEFLDMMDTNHKWQQTVYHMEHEYRYPMVLWDLLLSGGASQLHPHLQTILHSDKYYGAMENWRRAADRYNRQFKGRNYFNDIILVHTAIGLTVRLGDAVAMATITPKRDYEIVVISDKVDRDFNALLYCSIRTYFEKLNQYAFSMAIAFPTLDPEEQQGVIPVYSRLIARGPVQATRSDVGALDLLSVSNVNTDPYKLIHLLRQSVIKYKNSKAT